MLAANGMLALTFSGHDWDDTDDNSLTLLAADTITDELGNLWNQDGVAEEHSHLTTSDTIVLNHNIVPHCHTNGFVYAAANGIGECPEG